jgi:hypothetical protein
VRAGADFRVHVALLFISEALLGSAAVDLCDPHNEQDILLDTIISMSK